MCSTLQVDYGYAMIVHSIVEGRIYTDIEKKMKAASASSSSQKAKVESSATTKPEDAGGATTARTGNSDPASSASSATSSHNRYLDSLPSAEFVRAFGVNYLVC